VKKSEKKGELWECAYWRTPSPLDLSQIIASPNTNTDPSSEGSVFLRILR